MCCFLLLSHTFVIFLSSSLEAQFGSFGQPSPQRVLDSDRCSSALTTSGASPVLDGDLAMLLSSLSNLWREGC